VLSKKAPHGCDILLPRRTTITMTDPAAMRMSAAPAMPAMSAPVKAIGDDVAEGDVLVAVAAPPAPVVPADVVGAPTERVKTGEVEAEKSVPDPP
jgi:hypothetical protein